MSTKLFYISLLAFTFVAAKNSANAQTGYTAHEWGTFTTLCGSTGQQLNGLYLEEESLPRFVYSHKGFVPNPIIIDPGTKEERSYFMFCDHVTVKMETPVIYFYADKNLDVNVHVDFPYGTISQWYPQRFAGDEVGDKLDLSRKHNGFIQWKANVLAPQDATPLTPKTSELTKTWSAPRATDANNVKANGETEKYLFYRGIGNFELPIKMRFITSAELEIKNTGKTDIPFFFVYDKMGEGNVALWWSGKIKAGESNIAKQPVKYVTDEEIKPDFKVLEDELVKAGLYRKEAAAMLNTWEHSYFGTYGLKVFWIVPRDFTNEVLPLTLDPQPEKLERVLVGRSEILKPQFEKELFNAYKNQDFGKWSSDRYYQAYLERMAYLENNPLDTVPIVKPTYTGIHGAVEKESIDIYPNPVAGTLTLDIKQFKENTVNISLYNILGVRVYTFTQNETGNLYKHTIDVSALPKGTYILKVQTGENQHINKIIKQ